MDPVQPVTCPGCQRTYATREEIATIFGMTGYCPACGYDLTGLCVDPLIYGDILADRELDGHFGS